MSLRETFSELGTPLKVVIAVFVGCFSLFALVIGGAVVGTFVMDTGEGVNSAAPEASFSASTTDGAMTITFEAGGDVEATNLFVVVDDTKRSWADLSGTDGLLETGDSVTIDADRGTSVELVYAGGNSRITYGVFTA